MSTGTIEKMLENVEWAEIERANVIGESDLFATHSGVLQIGDFTIKCYRLNDGQAVFDADDFKKFWNMGMDDDEELLAHVMEAGGAVLESDEIIFDSLHDLRKLLAILRIDV